MMIKQTVNALGTAFAFSPFGMPLVVHGVAGLIVGTAMGCCGFSTVYGVIGRTVAPEKRSTAMGIVGAAGSLGQFLMLPYGQVLINHLGWQQALLVLAVTVLVLLPLSAALVEDPAAREKTPSKQSIPAALREAFRGPIFLQGDHVQTNAKKYNSPERDKELATLRALINNLSISSGPQVVVNAERLAPNEDGEEMYPWKRWFVQNDPLSNSGQPPISFFMPTSNAQEMMGVYQWLNGLADDISAIPKYVTGGGAGAGAARGGGG